MVGVESQAQPLLTPSQEDRRSGAQQGGAAVHTGLTVVTHRPLARRGTAGCLRSPPTQDPDPLTQPSQDFDHMLVRGVKKQGKS